MREVATAAGVTTVTQGEFAISDNPESIISTVLGSCVATCLWDPIARVGGLNHILVARENVASTACEFSGVNAMELLINALAQKGADRRRLRSKVFGGARMVSGLSDIGQLNGIFVLEFLEREGIPCMGKSLGGSSARQLRFSPTDGRAMLKTVSADRTVEPVRLSATAFPRNDVELF